MTFWLCAASRSQKLFKKLLDIPTLAHLAFAYNLRPVPGNKVPSRQKPHRRQYWIAQRFLVYCSYIVQDSDLLQWLRALFSPQVFPNVAKASASTLKLPHILTYSRADLLNSGPHSIPIRTELVLTICSEGNLAKWDGTSGNPASSEGPGRRSEYQSIPVVETGRSEVFDVQGSSWTIRFRRGARCRSPASSRTFALAIS